jgi:hypothetical protein
MQRGPHLGTLFIHKAAGRDVDRITKPKAADRARASLQTARQWAVKRSPIERVGSFSARLRRGRLSTGERGEMADTAEAPNLVLVQSFTEPRQEIDLEVSRWMRPYHLPTDVNSGDGVRANGAARNAEAQSARHYQARQRPPQRPVPQYCEWCRQPLGPRNTSGRTRVYCSQSCRQRAYQSRKRSRQLPLRNGELVVSSVLVARMNRRLQALESALLEVEKANLDATDERLQRLCQAARRLRRMVIGPPAR